MELIPPGTNAPARPRTRPAAALGLCATALALGTACRGGSAQNQGPPPMPVKVVVARAVPIDDTTDFVATLRSRDSADIMPQVEGQVTRIFVKSGDRVARGTPLVQIDPAKQQATVRSQEDTHAARDASLALARQQYERTSKLHAEGIASQADLDQAKAALDSAQADLQAAGAQVREQQEELRYYRVEAPTSGIVGDIPVRVGDRVTVSTLLTTVDRAGGLEAYVSIPVERASQVRMGMPVRILDGTGAVVAESRVTFVSPQTDPQTQTVLVKVAIDEEGTLRPAQFIRARVVWGTREGPLVPVLAVSRMSGLYFAFVAEGKDGALVAKQRPIKVGEIVGNDYAVLEGIKPGDRVIVSGTQFLRDGAPVAPQG
jgi:RND family efflux transporter MFP subunit